MARTHPNYFFVQIDLKRLMTPNTNIELIGPQLFCKITYLPFLRNGTEIKISEYKNTCAFDSFMQSLIALREHSPIMRHMCKMRCLFIDFIYNYRESNEWYAKRNILLNIIYPNLIYQIDDKKSCFGTLAVISDYVTKHFFTSIVYNYKCSNCGCETQQRHKCIGVDHKLLKRTGMRNLSKCLNKLNDKNCPQCLITKMNYKLELCPVITIDIEPIDRRKNLVPLNSFPLKMKIFHELYILKSVIEYEDELNAHFRCYVLRKKKFWECFDDIGFCSRRIEKTTDIKNPVMLTYINKKYE